MTKTLAIDWKVKKAKLSDLKEWVKNPRKLTAEAYEELLKSIKRDGFHDVLKIDVDGTILSGHQRKRALTELGIEEINVMYPDRKLTEKEMEIISIKSNRHEGTFDFDMLGNMFEMDTLLEAGFEKYELGFYGNDITNNVDSMYQGMPEFDNEELSFRDLIIHFRNQKDVDAFAKLIKQTITDKNKSYWFPEAEKFTTKNKAYES